MDDLNRAIVTIEQAVEITPADHPIMQENSTNWDTPLSRFKRTGLMDDLDRAIVANEQAVESAPVMIPIVPYTSTILGMHCRADSRGQDRWTTWIVRSQPRNNPSSRLQSMIPDIVLCISTIWVLWNSRFTG